MNSLERRRRPLIIFGSGALILILSPFIAGAIVALCGVVAYHDWERFKSFTANLWDELDVFNKATPEVIEIPIIKAGKTVESEDPEV